MPPIPRLGDVGDLNNFLNPTADEEVRDNLVLNEQF